MSKFNTPSSGTKTTNLAGAPAYRQTSRLEIASILLTSFLKDQFYRSEKDTVERIKQLVDADPQFAAKAAVFARKEFGMRSVTHLVAAHIAATVNRNHPGKGAIWVAQFLNAVVYRPDDVLEIIACYQSLTGKKVSNSMRKGLGAALRRFSSYQIAKYRKDGAEISMLDAVNLLHPKATDALSQLIKGTLPAADTWERGISAAGQDLAEGETVEAAKADEWKRLVDEDKLGYFALLRNLRNLLDHAADRVDVICQRLTDPERIAKSLVFPFRYVTALEVVKAHTAPEAKAVVRALNRAVDIACSNVPKFGGKTLIALDESGSMTGASSAGNQSCAQVAGLFAAVMLKAWGDDADLLTFADNARYHSVNTDDSVLSIAGSIQYRSGGTNFHSIFEQASRRYDRIIILSDMQAWIGGNVPSAAFNEYKRRQKAEPRVFTFDLHGYGSMQFPETNVFALAGFSDKVFETMALLDTDRQALVKKIEAVAF